MKKLFLILFFIKCFTLSVNAQEKDSLFIPNVADSLFTVYFTVLQNDTISLDIYNRWGQNVGAPLQETVLPKGKYQISTLTDSLDVDVYIYVFKRNSKKYNGSFSKLDSLGKTEVVLNENLKAYPNPFQTTTNIEFTLPATDTISLDIYNLSGVKVKSFFHEEILPIGNYILVFDSNTLPSGVYNVIFRVNSQEKKTKIVKTGASSVVNESHKNENQVSAYPNPVRNALYIDLDNTKTVVLVDINGKEVYRNRSSEKITDLSRLSIGMYILTVYNDKNEILLKEKLIKAE